MIKLKMQRNIGLTTSLVLRLVRDYNTVLVVSNKTNFRLITKLIEEQNHKFWKMDTSEMVHIRGRIVTVEDLLNNSDLVDETYTYLVDEGVEAVRFIALTALFDTLDTPYEAYFGYYGDIL